MGSSKLHADAGPTEPCDCLSVELFRVIAIAQQRAHARLDPERPVRSSRASCLFYALERATRKLRLVEANGRLDQFGESPYPGPAAVKGFTGQDRYQRIVV